MLGTVLNTHGEVVSYDGSDLDQQVHIARLDGGNYTVEDGDEETVTAMRAGLTHDEIVALPNVKVVDEPEAARAGCCRSNKTVNATKYVTISGKKYRAKYRVRIRNFSFLWWNIHRASSQLKSRKKNWIFWKKDYTTITINQKGNVYPSGYYSYVCIDYYWDEFLQQWVPYETICTYEVKCERDALSAAIPGTQINTWQYELQKNYSQKVSASDKDGPAGILRATFQWRGQTMNLQIC